MVEGVTAFYEFGSMRFNFELNFAQQAVIEFYVYKQVVGATAQSVLNAHNLQLLRTLSTDPLQLFVELKYLFLLGRTCASHQIAHLEGQQVCWGGPVGKFLHLVFFVQSLGHFQ